MWFPCWRSLRGSLSAEVKTREKTHAKLEGFLGGVVNLFGGKAAKEGVVSTTAVKGNRKATMNESTGQIVDLSEEKVYDLDMKKKTYEVTTFDELRRRMKEARDRAEKEAAKQQGKEEKPSGDPQKELQVDFDVKETGPEEAGRAVRRPRGDHDDHRARKGQDARGRRRRRHDRGFMAGPADRGAEGAGRIRSEVLAAAAGNPRRPACPPSRWRKSSRCFRP